MTDVRRALIAVSDKRGGDYVQARYEVFAAGEVLKHSFDARLSSDNEGVPDSLRMRLYRTDPQGNLLGPLKATHYAVGDVSLLSTGLVVVRQDGDALHASRAELPRVFLAPLARTARVRRRRQSDVAQREHIFLALGDVNLLLAA